MLKFRLFQMDVKITFLNVYLHEEIYVEQPKGFTDPNLLYHMFKLKKTLYGLKQARTAWYERLTDFKINHEYNRVGIYKTIFVKNDGGKLMIP